MKESMAKHHILLAALRDGNAELAIETMIKLIKVVGIHSNDLVSNFSSIKIETPK
tara:strand:+ start:577 stop:741 length:165 start_codon:yes stop_codon:yes gene_type:complete